MRASFVWSAIFLCAAIIFAQGTLTISGKVISETGKVINFAAVAVRETGQKAEVDNQGQYRLDLTPALYTFIVTSPGYKPLTRRVEVEKNMNLDFRLELVGIRGQTLILRDVSNKQNLGRKNLGQADLKETPATFGDSLSALATLPGIIRTNGFLGPLIVRGAPQSANRYFIDMVPVLYPQHFGAIQSVISNDLIADVSVYSSAFGAEFSQATGAIIDIETKDDIKKFKGVLDVGLISANFYLQSDISTLVKQDSMPSTSTQKGYWVAAARAGYLAYVIPPIVKLFGGSIIELPEYYDYQLKGKFFVDDAANHALTLFVFGSYDTWRLISEDKTAEERAEREAEGADPLTEKVNFSNRIFSNSQAFYYTYRPSDRLSNKMMVFTTFNDSLFFIDAARVTELGQGDRSIDVSVTPSIAGVKNIFDFEWWRKYSTIEFGLEYNYFWLGASGQSQQLSQPNVAQGNPDFADSSLFTLTPLAFDANNHLLGGHVKNRFTFGGLTVVPGARVDHLRRTNETTIDPRGLISYRFDSDTTISGAAGVYHSFSQVNIFLFNQPFDQQPQVAALNNIRPEGANHYAAGIEQEWGLYSIKVEGFYNEFFDSLVSTSGIASGVQTPFANTGSAISKGFEVLIRKDRRPKKTDFYGWVSYTYTRARFKLGVDSGIFDSETEYNFEFEQTHALKLVLGFKWGANSLGTRFELSSGFPYTPVVGSQELVSGRFSQVYGAPYSTNFPISHRLDLRYTRSVFYSSSTLKWYVEVINIYNFAPKNQVDWKYNQAFEAGVNPALVANRGIRFIPNLGLEYRF